MWSACWAAWAARALPGRARLLLRSCRRGRLPPAAWRPASSAAAGARSARCAALLSPHSVVMSCTMEHALQLGARACPCAHGVTAKLAMFQIKLPPLLPIQELEGLAAECARQCNRLRGRLAPGACARMDEELFDIAGLFELRGEEAGASEAALEPKETSSIGRGHAAVDELCSRGVWAMPHSAHRPPQSIVYVCRKHHAAVRRMFVPRQVRRGCYLSRRQAQGCGGGRAWRQPGGCAHGGACSAG